MIKSALAAYKNLLNKYLILLVIYSALRLLFLIAYPHTGGSFWILDFIYGIRFDLSAICLLMAPYLLVNAYVGSHQKNRWWRLISNSYFYLVVLISTLLNLIDIAWFEYTGKRTTSDIFSL